MRPAQPSPGKSCWRLLRVGSGCRAQPPLLRSRPMSAHLSPEQVRSKIDHPIVDGDGHWVEYDPVFSDKMRKVGGDLAADGFLKAMGTTRDALAMTPAERRTKRVGQSAFWSRQAENTLDRATAMMPQPALRAPRRDRPRFRRRLPDRRAALAAHSGRRHPPRGDPRLQHRLGRLFRQAQRPDDPGGDHPDAHARRGDRRTRIRHQAIGLEGRHVRQQHGPQGAGGRGQRPRHRALCGVVRRARHRQRIRLRSGLGEMRRIRHRPDLPQRRQQPGPAPVADQFLLQPYRPFRRRRACDRQGDLPRRRHKALPGAALRLSRRRGRLGHRSCSAI